MEILILLVLIFINGLFVMSEIALVSARKGRLEMQADKGDIRARKALDLSNNPEIFLSAAQIGITLIAILTGVYSGERFGVYLQPAIEKINFLTPYAHTIATTIIGMSYYLKSNPQDEGMTERLRAMAYKLVE